MTIAENIEALLKKIPPGVKVVAATKRRSAEEIEAALSCGIEAIGENYVAEAERKFKTIGKKARWHLIGHLQTNKINKAAGIFDLIQTLDSLKLAAKLNEQLNRTGRKMPVLIEINSGRESQKTGILPGDLDKFLETVSGFEHLEIKGLMTMGPAVEPAELLRPFFRLTRKLFETAAGKNTRGVKMETLSMGMSDSFQTAIEEGANLVRIGTAIFGPRPPFAAGGCRRPGNAIITEPWNSHF